MRSPDISEHLLGDGTEQTESPVLREPATLGFWYEQETHGKTC